MSTLEQEPYWWSGVMPVDVPTYDLMHEADIAIVGAGYTGLSAGIELLRSGRSVIILEAARVGEGASSRNGGMWWRPPKAELCRALRRSWRAPCGQSLLRSAGRAGEFRSVA
jgi:glycine/D-amino acid oxidase-like deaminating enzyme